MNTSFMVYSLSEINFKRISTIIMLLSADRQNLGFQEVSGHTDQ